MIILGVDPGIERTGYGVVEITRHKPLQITHLDHGCITTKRALPNAKRLCDLEKQLASLLKQYRPNAMAVETLFFFKNLKTVMPVSEARGVILLTGAKHKVPLYEFSPLQTKMAVVGYGRAEKNQVQGMVQRLLDLEKPPTPDDAADGLALAIACAMDITSPLTP